MLYREVISLPGFFAEKKSVCVQPGFSVDEETFCAVYKSVAPSLQRYLHRTCGNAALAEDIVQETFYRLLRAELPEMVGSQMKAYLYKTATSLLIDYWRREKRSRVWKILWNPPAMPFGDRSGDVSRSLSELKPAERSMLWLAYVEGFDHKEIASALGLKEKSIRVLLFRARRKLARILERHGAKRRRMS
jgi:RNA polymerase sigma-70 factor (ECF subfamily)